ncbi:MAG: type II toxin-antitoxin system PemK/MazF family toxin [Candidatus Peregrinibacteria bacterium]|nr:type II toxin-antitoxin system PemK/MazF family toxin [Candidatus Peregrinibacteria bacterium]MCB9807879.1 type II toxin-antitoxin system PemK/MazF family toxin [Candidatus Peribacteria bacterium]
MNHYKNFQQWNALKEKIHSAQKQRFFRKREVWLCHVGCNVGFEQDGKGNQWLRPVMILHKFNQHVFLCVPMTTTKKQDKHYVSVIHRSKQVSAIISQIRLLDSRRLHRKTGRLDKNTFQQVCNACRTFLQQEEIR